MGHGSCAALTPSRERGSGERCVIPEVEFEAMRQILETPEVREREGENRMKLAGAIYEIEKGRVRFLD